MASATFARTVLPRFTRPRPDDAPRQSLPWHDIAFVLLYSTVVPFCVYLAVTIVSTITLGRLLTLVATFYAVTALVITFEAIVAAPRRRAALPLVTGDGDEIPAVTALIVAYLPNEQQIILQTVKHFLSMVDVPPDKLQVLVVYNTPEPLGVEAELEKLARNDPRLLVVEAKESRSKAENINVGLQYARGEVIGLFDADHLPERLCFRKALRWLRSGYDAVQGRCVIRNGSENWLTRMIDVEFVGMYAVSHASRSLAVDAAIFGGSNGYWRKDALRLLRMDSTMLTEDIDVTVRGLIAGYRIIHDRSIISTELAPSSLTSWFHQRLRWAQGWHQVTMKHTRALVRTRALTRRQKLYFAYMLPWREAFAAVAPQAFPILMAYVVAQLAFGRQWWYVDPYLVATTMLTLGSGAITTLIAFRVARLSDTPLRVRDVASYVLVAPLFTLLRNIVTLAAWTREVRRDSEWVTTPRSGFDGERLEADVERRSLHGAGG